eukprot:1157896-Pelagomonas_calceolata.AAC.18
MVPHSKLACKPPMCVRRLKAGHCEQSAGCTGCHQSISKGCHPAFPLPSLCAGQAGTQEPGTQNFMKYRVCKLSCAEVRTSIGVSKYECQPCMCSKYPLITLISSSNNHTSVITRHCHFISMLFSNR